jgi:hypothetical protein
VSDLSVGSVATFRDGCAGQRTGTANPTIAAGARVEILDLAWSDGIYCAAVVVIESDTHEDVGLCASVQIGQLRLTGNRPRKV